MAKTEINFYNLIDEPFIQTNLGLQSFASLLAHAHEIDYIQCSHPLETLAIHRLLVAMLYRIYDITDKKTWQNQWKKGKFGLEAQKYLTTWYDHFFLAHPKYPFMQDSTVTGKNQSINKLKFMTDNDASLFSKDFIGLKQETPDKVAIQLICYQLMSLNSGKGLTERRANFHAAAKRGMAILISGNNLFETLLLNCHPYNERLQIENNDSDLPPWEEAVAFDVKQTHVNGYVNYLTQPSRRVKLIFNDNGTCTYAICEKAQEPSENILDPFVMYVMNKENELQPIRYQQTEYLWKHYKALSLSLKEGNTVRFVNNANLTQIDEDYIFSYRYFGMYMDSKLTKYKFVTEIDMPLRVADFGKHEEVIEGVVSESERIGIVLSSSIYAFFKYGLKLGKTLVQGRCNQWMDKYWDNSNVAFRNFLADLHAKNQEASNQFFKTMRKIACRLFEEVAREGNLGKSIEYMQQKRNLASFYGKVFNGK